MGTKVRTTLNQSLERDWIPSTRWPFNFTLFIAGVFGLAAGGSPNFVTLASLFAVVGFGVGGNMPVDSAVFLDFVPGSHQYLLTILSIWWAIGQLVASLVRLYMRSVPTGHS